jgi:hypothetical protein
MAGYSVVIDDLDIQHVSILPAETHTELVVDADAVLAGPVAFQGFQSVTGRHAQEVECGGGVELHKLASRHRFDVHEPSHTIAVEQGFRVLVGEGFDHACIVYR